MDAWDPRSGSEPAKVPYSRGIPQTTARSRASDADERRAAARRHLPPARRRHRRHADRADPGQLLRHLRTPTSSCTWRAACATNTACCSIIDEVKTGFRVAQAAACSRSMASPPISRTFAKAMANGYPIAAVAGREDIMRTFRYRRRGPRRHLHRPFGVARRGREVPGNSRRDPGARNARRLWRAAEGRDQGNPRPPRHRAFLLRPPVDVRPVLRRNAARQLPRLETIRLHLLRHAWPGTCTSSASSASRTRASPGSCARPTTRPASTIRCRRSRPRST